MESQAERLESLNKRLTPAVRAAIEKAIATDNLPSPLRSVIGKPALEYIGPGGRAAALEHFRPNATTLGRETPGRAPVDLATVMPLAGLEAIVQRTGRPPLLIQNNRVIMEDLPDFPAGTDAMIQAVEGRIPSVGRIEFLNYSMAWGGTGWVVQEAGGRRLVITNRHVAALVAKRKADGSAIFMRSPYGQSYGASIDFLAEADRLQDDSGTLRLSGIEYLADDISADIALLRIEAADGELPAAIEIDDGPVLPGELVAVIGYPAFDSRNDVYDQARYFRDLYEVKRLAPGFVLQPPDTGALFSHDCTTLGGNSGSPLIRLANGKAIGLHFQGLYGKDNSAVTAATLLKLLRGERPVATQLQATSTERADGRHPADHFKDRGGFNTRFLDRDRLVTPWPGLPADAAAQLAVPSDHPAEPNELRYTHFGVKYCAKRKVPVVTAVNIDGEHSVRIKRGGDVWFSDGRLSPGIQLGQANFADLSIDRGHMVRREDPNWGSDLEARLANDDTFHYVNACAQHASLNQGKTLWQGLENYILDSTRVHGLKCCVFTGPVLRGADDEDEIIIDGAVVPLEFWKVVVSLDADDLGLHATAYLLSQGQLIRKLLEKRSLREGQEGFVLGPYRTFQLAVSDLAEATGYDFAAYVAADPLRKSAAGHEALESGEPVVMAIESLADIRL
ncbi:nuclease [Kaistia algarum]|uniref:DNA/RNA non-specific endonuclease n=1 Tax=Kaistia algarum TaxID=2083279 RepID=UPI000CE7A831|nr:DNA/RNA non-specific endonuclease [Kaistia algarum]MCX5512985.1 DNA/RNA non-specific endonuclease [Kaistia algarum]PPE81528.1 nuclease [Kaistia algarum]